MQLQIVQLVFIVAYFSGSARANINTSVPVYVESLLDDAAYNRKERPLFNHGRADVIDVNLYVQSISSISETKMDYFVTVFLRQEWYEPRLAINGTGVNESVFLHYDIIDKMWVPDTYIVNEKSSGDRHDITTPNVLIKLAPEGHILYSQRISTVLSCPMELETYPMDRQTCSMQPWYPYQRISQPYHMCLQLEIYGHTSEQLALRWKRSQPVQISAQLTMPEFVLQGHNTRDCTQFYVTGSFSCIQVDFDLQRLLSYFVVQVYMPSILVVVLSWVSFWIDLYAVPARISVGLLTVVTISTQSSGINAKLPRVSYFKAIDVWLITCYVFIFGAFLEYAIVNVLSRSDPIDKEDAPNQPKANQPDTHTNEKTPDTKQNLADAAAVLPFQDTPLPPKESTNQKPGAKGEAGKLLWRKAKISMNVRIAVSPARSLRERFARWRLRMRNNSALMLDHVCRVCFPMAFGLFNIIYWSFYSRHALVE